MPPTTRPYDPQPSREDALAEAAAQGYAGVEGDHAASLQRLRRRTRGRAAGPSRLRRSWTVSAVAAAILALIVIGLQVYELTSEPIAADLPAEPSPPTSASRKAGRSRPAAESPSAPPPQRLRPPRPPIEVAAAPAARDPDLGTPSAAPPPVASATQRAAVEPPESSGASEIAATGDGAAPEADAPTEDPADLVGGAGGAEAATARATESAADEGLADDPPSAPAAELAQTSFALQRSDAAPALRELRVRVLDAGGEPIDDAEVFTETDRRDGLPVDAGGLRMLVPESALVGVATAPGFDTLRFDLTDAKDFTLRLSRDGRPLPASPDELLVDLVAPRAKPFAEFDAYVSRARRTSRGRQPSVAKREEAVDLGYAADEVADGDTAFAEAAVADSLPRAPADVVVQFTVDRGGRPRRIEAGPGPQDRDRLRRARRLLKDGPAWPESYRGQRWRYRVAIPEN